MTSLDAEVIRQAVDSTTAGRLAAFDAFPAIESTNSYLMQRPLPEPGKIAVALTDNQTAGRGRQGRTWLAPAGSGICLSMSYTFVRQPGNLPALTLAVGLGVIDALAQQGVTGVELKWPNDLIAADGKLGGILTETRSGSGSAVTIVTGVGINVDLGEGLDVSGDDRAALRVADLANFAAEMPSRNELAASLINGLCTTFIAFDAFGFAGYAERWAMVDWLHGRELTITRAENQCVSGHGAGLAEDGALLIATADGSVQRVTSGTVSATGGRSTR